VVGLRTYQHPSSSGTEHNASAKNTETLKHSKSIVFFSSWREEKLEGSKFFADFLFSPGSRNLIAREKRGISVASPAAADVLLVTHTDRYEHYRVSFSVVLGTICVPLNDY
jgi:hypothetical protein